MVQVLAVEVMVVFVVLEVCVNSASASGIKVSVILVFFYL